MKSFLLWAIIASCTFADETAEFIQIASKKHGALGEKAAKFLVENMPKSDRENLSADFLVTNLDLALKARESFPWAKEVPEDVFFNDVLPYAVFDEPRDPWRAEFMQLAKPIVHESKSASEAAQSLNREFFNKINVHYNTGRKRTNQSPKESIEQGKATCTGLSIILVDACRSVGIPARAVGIPMWTDESGNHTWVEIYDSGKWHYTGADEYNKEGLNKGWFTKKAGQADATDPMHSIYATSWKNNGVFFPLPWSPNNKSISAVNVTARYAQDHIDKNTIGVRLFADNNRESRVSAPGRLMGDNNEELASFTTKSGTADMNDMPRIEIIPGESYRIEFIIDGETYQTEAFQNAMGESIVDIKMGELKLISDKPDDKASSDPLSKQEAQKAIQATYKKIIATEKATRTKELEDKSITIGEHTMKWLEKTFGKEPKDGRSLWISMHGGGGAPARVNDQQWQNQIRLYKPDEGIYVAPRAPTNTWNLWHQGHIDPLFSRLIENMVAYRGVNPEKVYLMGYSAGGDGVWQLAPRMADRFAAASMMAGHPNESKLLGVRNLPFGIFMGGNDKAYDRNKVAAEKIEKIKQLQADDKDGYVHMARIYEGLPHWMNLKDAESIPWMAKFTRKTWPDKIVWYQDDVTHDRFYWLELPEGAARKEQLINASVDGQKVTLKGDIPKGTRILLNDAFIDLDKPIEVIVNDKAATTHNPKRSLEVIKTALENRLDPRAVPTALIELN